MAKRLHKEQNLELKYKALLETYDQVNKAVLTWFKRLRAKNVPVNGVLIKGKALYFAKECTFENFQASNGWLDKWKKRVGLFFF